MRRELKVTLIKLLMLLLMIGKICILLITFTNPKFDFLYLNLNVCVVVTL